MLTVMRLRHMGQSPSYRYLTFHVTGLTASFFFTTGKPSLSASFSFSMNKLYASMKRGLKMSDLETILRRRRRKHDGLINQYPCPSSIGWGWVWVHDLI